jgi:hypothetical protein
MVYATPPGAVGLDSDASGSGVKPMDTQPVIGLGDEPEPLSDQRKITRVSKDWGDPPTPTVTNTPTIGGTTLKEALAELQKLSEWGTGGGNLSAPGGGEIQLTTKDGKSYTAEIHGEFFMTLPEWSGYAKATAAQQQAWDTMVGKLRKHEQEHVNIAYKNAQKLVQGLTNLPVEKAAQKIADVQQAGQDAQDDFDSVTKTDHGKNDFGGFPKVELDTSADPPPPPPPPKKP